MNARWTPEQLDAWLSDPEGSESVPKKKRVTKPGKKPETANRITANIIRAVNMQPGCVAYRINNVGVWDEAKQVYRRGNTQKGIGDIHATIRGRSVWIEVKAGKDKLSAEQMMFRQEVECAGGVYFEARNTDYFLNWFTEFLKK